jgi:hypothetical protein
MARSLGNDQPKLAGNLPAKIRAELNCKENLSRSKFTESSSLGKVGDVRAHERTDTSKSIMNSGYDSGSVLGETRLLNCIAKPLLLAN